MLFGIQFLNLFLFAISAAKSTFRELLPMRFFWFEIPCVRTPSYALSCCFGKHVNDMNCDSGFLSILFVLLLIMS